MVWMGFGYALMMQFSANRSIKFNFLYRQNFPHVSFTCLCMYVICDYLNKSEFSGYLKNEKALLKCIISDKVNK